MNASTAADVSCVVFGLQRFSLDDGPGVRTVVFLKGCNLRCCWCHNPESIAPGPVLSFQRDRCIGCGACFQLCPVHQSTAAGHVLDRSRCTACGKCAAACPGQALSLVGEKMTAAAVMDTVVRDRRYYRDGGGLTVSGGEPTRQPEFLRALLALARENGIATAVETNGMASDLLYRDLLPLVDVFLWDIKETDSALHRHYTGHGNETVLANLRVVSEGGGRVVLRCPLIPGVNDREEHLAGVEKLIRATPGVIGAQVMPYHRLASGKVARYGLPPQREFVPPSDATVDEWNARFAKAHASHRPATESPLP